MTLGRKKFFLSDRCSYQVELRIDDVIISYYRIGSITVVLNETADCFQVVDSDFIHIEPFKSSILIIDVQAMADLLNDSGFEKIIIDDLSSALAIEYAGTRYDRFFELIKAHKLKITDCVRILN